MADIPILWNTLLKDIYEILKSGISDLLQGAEDDIDNYLGELSFLMLEAIKTGDAELFAELKAAARVIAETQRVRAVNESWEAIEKIVDIAVFVGRGVLKSIIPVA